MSGASIAAEVAAALQEVANDVGSGTFAVTLTQDNGEPTNPWDTDTSTETATNMAALIQNYPLGMIDGTLIRAEDRKVMLPATGPRPTTADRLTIAGKVYVIVNIMETSPSGVPLFYECQVRA